MDSAISQQANPSGMWQVPDTSRYSAYLGSNASNSSINSQLDPPPQYTSFRTAFVRNYSFPLKDSGRKAESSTSPYKSRASSLKERLARRVLDGWLWEILSWTISAICMFAIALTLGLYNKHALPARWPGGVSLNAVLAALSAIAKYALVVPAEEAIGQLKWLWFQKGVPRKLVDLERFDEASRGPWGSLTFVARFRTRSLASLGAVIVLLSLTIDPFFQQLISYPKRPGFLGISTLTRAVSYEPRGSSIMKNGTRMVGPPDAMYGAVKGAFFGDGSFYENGTTVPGAVTSTLSPFCGTNLCVWPSFSTLGICSQCRDISNLLQFGCYSESGVWMNAENSAFAGTGRARNNSGITTCGYFLNATSSSPVLMSGYALKTGTKEPGEALLMRAFPMVNPWSNETFWDGSYNFKDEAQTHPMLTFMVSLNLNIQDVYANKTPAINECIFRYCVKKVSAKSEDGVYTEKVEATYTNDTFRRSPYSWKPTNQSHGISVSYSGNLTITPPGQNETFSINEFFIHQTNNPMRNMIPGYITAANSTARPGVRLSNLPIWEPVGINWNVTAWPERNLTKWADGLATAITNVIRTDTLSAVRVLGYGGLETYIHIEWGWFILPVFVLFATLVLLISTIIMTRQAELKGIWKTSSLGMLLNGLEEKTRSDLGDATNMYDIMEKARDVTVRLMPGLDGYRFQRIDSKSKWGGKKSHMDA